VITLAKNSRPLVIVMKVADTNMAKNDVPIVRYSLYGRGYGVLVVDVY